jgi:HEAT repeat protein
MISVRFLIVAIATLVFSTTVNAAIKGRGSIDGQAVNKELKASMRQTLLALDLPFANRIASLRSQGPTGYKNLRSIMFDPDSKIDARWRSTMAVGRLGGRLSLPELERASKADVWELRSAALIAVSRIDRRTASIWARRLLKDKALLVRLTAVETLEGIQDRAAVADLWAQLDNRQNFKRNRSLFIRRRIVEALTRLESPESSARFASLLDEDDPQILNSAIAALEKLTGQTMGKPTDPLARRRALWQQWQMSRG